MEPWITTSDLAVLFGCKRDNALKTYGPIIQPCHKRKVRGRWQFDAAGVVKDFVASEVGKVHSVYLTDDDALLAADKSDSPNLERLRAARATLAELDVAERMGRLIPRDEMHAAGDHFATIMRGVSQRLQIRFGPEAAQDYDDGLDEASESLDTFFAEYHKKEKDYRQQAAT